MKKLGNNDLNFYLDELQKTKSPFRKWWIKNCNKNASSQKNKLIDDLRKKEMLKFKEKFHLTMKNSKNLLKSMKNDYKKFGQNKYYLIFLNNVALYTHYKNFQFGGQRDADVAQDPVVLGYLLEAQKDRRRKLTNDEITYVCMKATSMLHGVYVPVFNSWATRYHLPPKVMKKVEIQAQEVSDWQRDKQLNWGQAAERSETDFVSPITRSQQQQHSMRSPIYQRPIPSPVPMSRPRPPQIINLTSNPFNNSDKVKPNNSKFGPNEYGDLDPRLSPTQRYERKMRKARQEGRVIQL